MTLSIERDNRRMGLAPDRTVYSSKRNRPLLLYGRLLDDSRPSHGLCGSYSSEPDCNITSGLLTIWQQSFLGAVRALRNCSKTSKCNIISGKPGRQREFSGGNATALSLRWCVTCTVSGSIREQR